jgi:ferritin-like metal-binding protein YciE
MKWLSEDYKNLRALYVHQLRVLLSAEEQLVRALPNMEIRATDEQLRGILRSHLQETELHIQRLEQILGEQKKADPAVTSVGAEKCKTIAALVTEADDMMVDAPNVRVRDAGLIAAAQRVEHYEMASYGTARQWARVLGETAEAELLDQTLKEEKHADELLSSVAERINPHAHALVA